MTALNVWDADCKVCDKRISVVAEWTPFEDGIRHVTCIPAQDDARLDDDLLARWLSDDSWELSDDSWEPEPDDGEPYFPEDVEEPPPWGPF